MEKLNLVKDRKFGENISMAFDFIKQNIGNTKKLIIYLLVLSLVAGVLTIIPIVGSVLATIISVVASILVMTYVISYMKLYVESADGAVNEDYAMETTKGNIGSVLIGAIVFFVVLVIAYILLVIPGIFLSVACAFFGFCIVNYNLGAVDSLKKSNELVKNNWWVTFGYSLVVGLVLGIISGIVSLIGTLFMFLGIAGVAVGTFITYIVSFTVSIITYFALGVHYYNLVDKKEGVNLTSQIDSIGENN